MGLFKKKENKKIELGAPVSGQLVPITTVSDPVFAEEMTGKGVAIQPEDGVFYAPCDGALEVLVPTGHAYGITTQDGVELFVHIGLDTVKLDGQFFTVHKKQGDVVKKGDRIVEADIAAIKEAGYDTVTLLIVSNPGSYPELEKKEGKVTTGDPVMILGGA